MKFEVNITPETKISHNGHTTTITVEDAKGLLFNDIVSSVAQTVPVVGEVKS